MLFKKPRIAKLKLKTFLIDEIFKQINLLNEIRNGSSVSLLINANTTTRLWESTNLRSSTEDLERAIESYIFFHKDKNKRFPFTRLDLYDDLLGVIFKKEVYINSVESLCRESSLFLYEYLSLKELENI